MQASEPIAIFVKLGYWDAYRSAVVLTARIFRKILIIFGVAAAATLALFLLAAIRPRPETDWQHILYDGTAVYWVFALPIVFVFVLPLLSARRVLADERVKRGVHYRFSSAGIHVENSVATADLKWAAVQHAIETQTSFLLFPNSNLAHTLPKRSFANDAETASFRQLLKSNVPSAKLRKT